jgi:hypothetical protein
MVIDSANRATGRGRPGIEASAGFLVTFLAGYLLCGYATPESLFLGVFVAQCVSMAAGLRHLVIGPVQLDVRRALVPRLEDVRDICRESWTYLQLFLSGLRRRVR